MALREPFFDAGEVLTELVQAVFNIGEALPVTGGRDGDRLQRGIDGADFLPDGEHAVGEYGDLARVRIDLLDKGGECCLDRLKYACRRVVRNQTIIPEND